MSDDLPVSDPLSEPGPVSDDEALAGYAAALADTVEEVLAGWVHRVVSERTEGRTGLPADLDARAAAAGTAAVQAVVPALRRLLATDVDEQRTNPLALLRGAVRFPTAVLRDLSVPPVPRDDFARRILPDDDYDLAPAAFADIDPRLGEPGLVWGAAKAHVILGRRRAEGRR